jgi:rRNA small subunit pseudouridine methyltransferase Nep1
MERLPENQRRGRPDIANVCLLEALGAPLNKEGGLRAWIHTYGGYAIEIAPGTKLPRDCNRFNSLMEQLFADGRVPPGNETPLMTLERMTLGELIEKIGPTHTVALTSHGKPDDLEHVCDRLSSQSAPAVLVGAFPHGPMKEDTLVLADEVISIHPEALEAWVVTSRLVYEFEKALRRR